MAKETTSIHDLMTELQTWYSFSPEYLEKAKKSQINNANHRRFGQLLNLWAHGRYDEDVNSLCYSLESLLD